MKKSIASILSVFLLTSMICFTGCNNQLLKDSSKESDDEYGTISIQLNNSDRSYSASSVIKAKVFISGSDIESDLESEMFSLASGSGSVTVEKIPVGKNRIITVKGYDKSAVAIEGAVIRTISDINVKNDTISVTRETTALGNVFHSLKALGVNTTAADKTKISNAIDSNYPFEKINTTLIASDYKAGSLKDKSKYIISDVVTGIVVYTKDYPYIWYWEDGAAGTLGEMESVSQGDYKYCYSFPDAEKINIIFRKNGGSNWSDKTDDLSRTTGIWFWTGSKWISGDTEAPVVSVISPAAGTTVSETVTILVNASDNTGVSKIEFFVDDEKVGTTKGETSFEWDSSDASNGTHKFYAIAYDAAENSTKSAEVSVITKNAEKQPVANAGGNKICVETIKTTFDGSKSTGSIATYYWEFGDGSSATGKTVTHTYTTKGTYKATLTVGSAGGLVSTDTVTVTVNEKGSFVHRDFREETVYFMMTDRFVDGDKTNNNIWGDEYLPNGESQMYDYSEDKTGILTYYHGGDFKGIIDNLDYIKDMGFTAIWITPSVKQPEGRYYYDGSGGGDAYQASAFHGYWGYDFDQIDPHLHSSGKNSDGWDDYRAFIQACHDKGIRVMQDIVLNHGNHTAATAPTKWQANPVQTIMDGKKWAWAVMDPYYEEVPKGATPSKNGFYSYYGFGSCADLIDFGHLGEDGKDSRQHLINVYKKFIDAGVDAFRIDTMAYIPSEFAGEFADAMYNYAKSLGNDYFYMVGEAWCDRYTAVDRHARDTTKSLNMLDMHLSCMDYPGEMQVAFQNNGDGFDSRWNNVMASSNVTVDGQKVMTDEEWTKTAMFVDNHDVYRDEAIFNEAQFKNALNYIYLFRGVPIVYYGTEAYYSWSGTHPSTNKDDVVARWMLGQKGIDYVKANKPNMYKHLKMLNQIHAESEIVKYGEQTNIKLGAALVYTRSYNGKTGYFVNALSSAGGSHSFDVAEGTYTLYSCSGDTLTTSTVSGGKAITVTAPANGFAFLDPK